MRKNINNYNISSSLPERYMSLFTLLESMSSVPKNWKLYFGMSCVSLIFFILVVSKKLSTPYHSPLEDIFL